MPLTFDLSVSKKVPQILFKIFLKILKMATDQEILDVGSQELVWHHHLLST